MFPLYTQKAIYKSELNQLSATVGALLIDDSTVSWNNGAKTQTSSFKGQIEISDITQMEGLLNFTSALQRGELEASAELSWKGNPTDIDPRIINGQMIFQNGSGQFVQAAGSTGIKIP